MGAYNYSYQEFTTKLRKLGFLLGRQAKGSHEIWYNDEKDIAFSVPHRAGKSISIGVIKSFLRVMNLTKEEFQNI